MIITAITLAIISWMFYYFFIRGNAWIILFFIFGIFGGRTLILEYFPSTSKTIMTFMSYNICYATFIAAVISILAVGVIMERISNE
jgi:hypothetical protein